MRGRPEEGIGCLQLTFMSHIHTLDYERCDRAWRFFTTKVTKDTKEECVDLT